MKRLIFAFVALAAMSTAVVAQDAPEQCLTVDALVKAAKENHFEPKSIGKVVVPGKTDADVAMMTFVDPKGNWQIFFLSGAGRACSVAFGTNYQDDKTASPKGDDRGI